MAAKLAILAHTLRAFATKFYCWVSDHALNVATHKFLNTAHEQFCRACHSLHLFLRHYIQTIIITFLTQLLHTRQKAAKLRINYACLYKMQAKAGQHAVMRTRVQTICYKKSLHRMKACIIISVGCNIPILQSAHILSLCHKLISSFKLQAYQRPAFLICQTHTNTIPSCSTFL